MSATWLSNIAIGRNVVQPAAPPPPVPVQSMQNGLSLVGTAGELGANPLLHATDIEQAGNLFSISEGGNPFFTMFMATVFIGDAAGSANNSVLTVQDSASMMNFSVNGAAYLSIDAANFLYQFGNNAGLSNLSHLLIDDNNQLLQFLSGVAADPYLSINPGAGSYLMGDINGTANGSTISIDDASQLMDYFDNAGGAYLSISSLNQNYYFGHGNPGLGLRILNSAGSERVRIFNATNNFLDLDIANNNYEIGDNDGLNNGMFIRINDAANTFEFTNTAATAGILINGVAGFTGVVAPVNTITVNNGIVTNVA